MAKTKAWEVTDEFWSRVEPLIPVRQRIAAHLSGDTNICALTRAIQERPR